jgi:hypothetical protein
VKSVRLSPAQQERLRAAAQRRGISESQLIRGAIDRACAEVLDQDAMLIDLVGDLVGVGHGGGGQAERTGDAFGEQLADERKRASG